MERHQHTKSGTMIFSLMTVATIFVVIFCEGYLSGSYTYFLGGDTEAYYIHFNHIGVVMPLYPLFIHALDILFGDALYLHVAALIQMVFLICVIIYTVSFFRKEFELSNISTWIIWLFSIIPFIILLPEDPIGHTLMTESFTYPLVYLYTCFTIKGIYGIRMGFFHGLIIALLATLVRSQMMFLFAVSMIAYIYSTIRDRGNKKNENVFFKNDYFRMICFMFLCLFMMKSSSMIQTVYERFFFDAPNISYSDQTLVQHMLYLSDEEDERLFSNDKDACVIFQETYDVIDQEKANYKYCDKGYSAWKKIVRDCGADSYALNDVIEEYYSSIGTWPENEIKQEELRSDIFHRLAVPLLKVHWKDKIMEALELMPSGFVSTILFHKDSLYPVIYIMTIVLYVVAFVSGFRLIHGTGRKIGELILLVFLMSAVNVVACNLIHFGLQRYLAYTLGLNWIGLYLTMVEIRKHCKWRERK